MPDHLGDRAHGVGKTCEEAKVFEVGGKQAFVQVIAFNALYRWGGGEGQKCGE